MSDDRFDRLEAKIDDVKDKLVQLAETNYKAISELKLVAVENTLSLDEHMRRTEAVEENNKLLSLAMEQREKENAENIKPLFQFMDRVKFSGVILGSLGGAVATIATLQRLGLLDWLFGKR